MAFYGLFNFSEVTKQYPFTKGIDNREQIAVKIKTHGSVSCGPRSRRVTPVSILTGRKCNFRTSVALCCLDETRRFLLWTCPPTAALHNPNLSEIAFRVVEFLIVVGHKPPCHLG